MSNRINVHKSLVIEEVIIPFDAPTGSARRGAEIRVPRDITPEEAEQVCEALDRIIQKHTSRRGLAGAIAEQDHGGVGEECVY